MRDINYYAIDHQVAFSHHGVKGQKWGVRRYQNKDGTRTELGKRQRVYRERTIRAGKTRDQVNEIVSSMSKDDRRKLGMDENENEYMSYEEGSHVVKRIIKKKGDIPVAFFDILDDENYTNVVIGTRAGSDYRSKGYAKQAAKEGMTWYEKNKHNLGSKPIYWSARSDNIASIKIAKSLGFKGTPGRKPKDSGGYQWDLYYKK